MVQAFIEAVIIIEEEVNTMAAVLKVSAKTNASSLAGALAGTIREEGRSELQTIVSWSVESGY